MGATFRLFFAAGLSMFDFVTDVIMILDYYQAGQIDGPMRLNVAC